MRDYFSKETLAQQQKRAATEQFETQRRHETIERLFDKCEQNADTVRRNYTLSMDDDKYLDELQQRAATQQAHDDAFLKGFTAACTSNGYNPR